MAATSLRVALRRAKWARKRRLAAAIWFLQIRANAQRRRTIWTKQWLLRRDDLGAFDTLLAELRMEDQACFLNFLRVSPGIFDSLLDQVSPIIRKKDTTYRKSISPAMRLAITLRFLATGKYFRCLMQ